MAQQPVPEVIVVDNASSDGSAEAVRREYGGVRVVESKTNLGYGGGINRGICASHGELLLLLNSDTEMLPGALASLMCLMQRDGSVGVAAPRLVFPTGEVQSSRRRFPSMPVLLAESTAWQNLPAVRGALRSYYCHDRPHSHCQAIDWAVGACLLVRRQALEEAGAMDESYFMYSEEVDLQRRLRQLGWQVVYEPSATVVHHESMSADQSLPGKVAEFNRAKVTYAAKHLGAMQARILRYDLLASLGLELAKESAKLAVGHKPDLRRSRIALYRQVLRGGLRPRE